MKKLVRPITVLAAVIAITALFPPANVATAVVPAPAVAATVPVYQTSSAACRSNLAAPRSILLIGDSITAGWFAATTAQLAAARRPACINAQAGRTTAQGVATLAAYKKAGMVTANTTVVMAVGSNDTRGAKDGYIRWQVDNVLRVVGTRQPVVWVDVLNWWVSHGVVAQRAYGAGTWVVNQQLWQKDAQYPSIRVAHWNAMIRSHYATYLFDGLHTNRFGNTARNNLILRTIG